MSNWNSLTRTSDLPTPAIASWRSGCPARRAICPRCASANWRCPTASRPTAFRHGELWDLLSLLVPQAVRLDKGGLTQLRRLCARWAENSVDAGRRFDALVSLSTARVRGWLPGKPASAFVHGLEVRLVVDEQRFAAFSLSGFAHVMDRFFAPYVPVTSFVQVVLFSAATGAVLRRGAPRPGTQPLV
ncbi:type VI secretion system baseplate subunit TssF [Burkholderia anthina]|uniref:type VI secretion system baseplate subunit TssF n=1 Tax=Burkholderia anthina TaxID=179879 RepID=UPI001E416247|nr:type VI secretion system baseplate subunit TssF [Burkholderia anthina]